MIDPGDLMFDNAIAHSVAGVVRICSLKHKSCTVFNKDNAFRHFKYSDLEPIELSDKLLLLLGFKAHKMGWFYRDDLPIVIILVGINWLVKSHPSSLPLSSVKYLHNVQNLYYQMTGIKLVYNPIQKLETDL